MIHGPSALSRWVGGAGSRATAPVPWPGPEQLRDPDAQFGATQAPAPSVRSCGASRSSRTTRLNIRPLRGPAGAFVSRRDRHRHHMPLRQRQSYHPGLTGLLADGGGRPADPHRSGDQDLLRSGLAGPHSGLRHCPVRVHSAARDNRHFLDRVPPSTATFDATACGVIRALGLVVSAGDQRLMRPRARCVPPRHPTRATPAKCLTTPLSSGRGGPSDALRVGW